MILRGEIRLGIRKKLNEHYAWKIVAVFIFIKLGIGGASMAITGNFITPVVQELGIKVSDFTTIVSIQAIVMALLYTTASKIILTKRIGVVVGIASLIEVIGIGLMSSYTSIYSFYFSGAIIGASQAFTGFVAIPLILNMWFDKKAGTALGLVVGVGFGASIGYSLLSAQLITVLGWRTAYLILALMGGIISIPISFLLLKSPEEAGWKPYGYEETIDQVEGMEQIVIPQKVEEQSLTRKEAFGYLFFYLAWITCLCYSYAGGVSGYIANFSTMELGQTITFGAQAAIFLSIGGILSSLMIGYLNDKFGVKAGLIWGAFFVTLGYGVMFLSFKQHYFVFPAAFIVGLSSGMYSVQCPLLIREIIGPKNYPQIWSTMMMVNSLVGGGLYATIGLFYDNYGTYRGAFLTSIGFHILAMLIGFISINLSNRQKLTKDLMV